jgi:sugar phosphate isomerase/epimerase
VQVADGLHLTYCTNIHPAVGWEAVLDSLRAHAPELKARLSPDAPFGIGLRLSGDESRELLDGTRLDDFRAWLDAEGLYVFTINGFPHGTFHGQPVKADVHAPDWRSEERVAYTLRLAEILSALLPDGVDGTISTSPLSYRPWVDGDLDACTANVVRVGEELRGTRIALAVEPEADGALANVDDLVRWWPDGLENVTVCFDACHSAVAYEEPEAALDALDAAGIRVGKAQLSAALIVPAEAHEELRAFADPIYLHQVTERGSNRSWPDLPEALADDGGGEEWRVHFHVPIFVERYGALRSTQEHLERCIRRVRTSHLEIETYTWDVLPAELKASSVDSIAREYEWVLDVLR